MGPWQRNGLVVWIGGGEEPPGEECGLREAGGGVSQQTSHVCGHGECQARAVSQSDGAGSSRLQRWSAGV